VTERKKKLYLIDGFHTIFRAFYAIRELTNPMGDHQRGSVSADPPKIRRRAADLHRRRLGF
jgi:5'-3' exonuclease